MAPTLAAAKAAAERGAWHFILGLARGATVAQIQKARRQLQREAHVDKGGSSELSTLINVAADNLLQPQTWDASRNTQDDYDTSMRKMQADQERRNAQKRQEDQRRWEERYREEQRKRKADGLVNAMRLSSRRGAGLRSRLLLSDFTGDAFPTVRKRLQKLRRARARTASRALVYAAESEIIARRCARETRFPKTTGMSERDPLKAERLKVLKAHYDKAYQRLRYLTSRGQPSLQVFLSTRRLLGEAWATLLAIPAFLPSGRTIELGDR